MRFYNKKQNMFFTLVLVFELFITSAFSASAGLFGVSLPSASSIMSDMEQRYHLDPAALQNQGEMMNVSGTKGYAPEVSLSFSPNDPKPGEKLSAKAFPLYFSNDEANLYYTWYLKRKGCDLKASLNDANRFCDADGNGKITVEDWKVEAARIIAQNGYDNSTADYAAPSKDDDGYKARFGGDNKTNVPNRCYANDTATGVNYEFVASLPASLSGCASGVPVCEVEQSEVVPAAGGFTSSGGNGTYSVSGFPTCTSSVLTCTVGIPNCVTSLQNLTAVASPSECSTISEHTANPYCSHLFPNSDVDQSGNGSFGSAEEKFWGTNPQDPSTADNGNKDEANVAGLGQSTFTWNYDSGDQVGVAVEGTSMFPTKFGDSSYMIMWAFPKKNCPVLDLADRGGEYTTNIKGYDVNIPAVEGFDLNKCFERNLVNPTEGGQATNLSVSVSATPESPINDPGGDKSGDTVIAHATVDNAAQAITNITFDWKVIIGKSIGAFNNGASTNTRKDMTSRLRELGLLGNTKGNALDTIKLKLDIPASELALYLDATGAGYLKFQSTATENFSGGVARKGKSDVIVKFVSSGDTITAYSVVAKTVGDTTKVSLNIFAPDNGKICFTDPLERTVCRVIKNEIIGLKVDGTGLSNFNWMINGSSLLCTARVSSDCAAGGGSSTVDKESQGNINYFPVSGNVGDTYTVTMTANNVTTGKVVNMTRVFNVVEPKVILESVDKTLAWRKFLGQYKDISGSSSCQGSNGYCDDLSESIYQTYSGSNLSFKATFIPGFLGNPTTTKKQWSNDGDAVTESVPGVISFTANKQAGGMYTINLLAQSVQPDNIRKALLDIWGISPFESPEINFASSIQVEIQEPLLTEGPLSGPRKYYAAIASYIPASILFTFRIFLSVVLTLFALHFLYSLLEERRVESFVQSFSRSRDK